MVYAIVKMVMDGCKVQRTEKIRTCIEREVILSKGGELMEVKMALMGTSNAFLLSFLAILN